MIGYIYRPAASARIVLLIEDTVAISAAGVARARSSLCSFFMAKVSCSIEMEPRTLSHVQLNHAREMAADVVQKMESDEASATFNEGMRPISSKTEMEQENTNDGGVEQQNNEGVEPQNNRIILKLEEVQVVYCQCQCATASVETPDQEELKEPLSAPF